MAWSDSFQHPSETGACANWLKKEDKTEGKNTSARMLNFSLCVSTTLGDKQVIGVAPLQSKQTWARIVDILITFGTPSKQYWNFYEDAPKKMREFIDKLVQADTVKQRSAVSFERLARKLLTVLWEDYLAENLALLRDKYDKEISEAVDLYFLALFEEQLQKPESTLKSLTELREHQRMKLDGKKSKLLFTKGGHTEGMFYLNSRAADGQPVLLVSSKLSKKISVRYRQIVEPGASVSMSGTRMMGAVTAMGTYLVVGDSIQLTSSSKDLLVPCRIALTITGVKSLRTVIERYKKDAPASVFE